MKSKIFLILFSLFLIKVSSIYFVKNFYMHSHIFNLTNNFSRSTPFSKFVREDLQLGTRIDYPYFSQISFRNNTEVYLEKRYCKVFKKKYNPYFLYLEEAFIDGNCNFNGIIGESFYGKCTGCVLFYNNSVSPFLSEKVYIPLYISCKEYTEVIKTFIPEHPSVYNYYYYC